MGPAFPEPEPGESGALPVPVEALQVEKLRPASERPWRPGFALIPRQLAFGDKQFDGGKFTRVKAME
jgi:hypothetical protein